MFDIIIHFLMGAFLGAAAVIWGLGTGMFALAAWDTDRRDPVLWVTALLWPLLILLFFGFDIIEWLWKKGRNRCKGWSW